MAGGIDSLRAAGLTVRLRCAGVEVSVLLHCCALPSRKNVSPRGQSGIFHRLSVVRWLGDSPRGRWARKAIAEQGNRRDVPRLAGGAFVIGSQKNSNRNET